LQAVAPICREASLFAANGEVVELARRRFCGAGTQKMKLHQAAEETEETIFSVETDVKRSC